MDGHPDDIGEAVGLALADVEGAERLLPHEELLEGGGRGHVPLHRGRLHANLHLVKVRSQTPVRPLEFCHKQEEVN